MTIDPQSARSSGAQPVRVIFELNNVLARYDSSVTFEMYAMNCRADEQLSAEEIERRYSLSGLHRRLLVGGNAPIFDWLRALLKNQKLSDEDIRTYMREAIQGPNVPMVGLKHRLHESGCTIGITSELTKWDSMNYGRLVEQLFLDDTYSTLVKTWDGPFVYSCVARTLRPALYEQFDDFDGDTILIGAHAAHVKYAADKLGWIGVHYGEKQELPATETFKTVSSVDGLEDVLRRSGVEF